MNRREAVRATATAAVAVALMPSSLRAFDPARAAALEEYAKDAQPDEVLTSDGLFAAMVTAMGGEIPPTLPPERFDPYAVEKIGVSVGRRASRDPAFRAEMLAGGIIHPDFEERQRRAELRRRAEFGPWWDSGLRPEDVWTGEHLARWPKTRLDAIRQAKTILAHPDARDLMVREERLRPDFFPSGWVRQGRAVRA